VTYLSHGFKQDRLISIENVTASSGDDVIIGTSSANVIRAGYGRNVVEGGGGNDTIIGGDMAEEPWPEQGVIEVLSGGAGNDVIYSNGSTTNPWDGRDSPKWSKDFVSGGSGNDRLISGFGFVTMSGGAGADRFEVSTAVWDDYSLDHFVGLRGTYTRVQDFNRSQGDKFVVSILDDDYWGTFDGTPDFVGKSNDVGFGEIGYRVERSGGTTDTIVEFVINSFWGWDEETDVMMTIHLEDYSGDIRLSDFVFI
jgi:Ca2+-binding RTX toxin-like protein